MSEESDERETKPFKFVTAGMLPLKLHMRHDYCRTSIDSLLM